MACLIIFIKLNKFETMDGLLDKFVIGDVIFIYFIDIVNVDHCTDTVGIILSCTPSIRVTVFLILAKNIKGIILGHSEVRFVNLSDSCISPHKAIKRGNNLLKNAFYS